MTVSPEKYRKEIVDRENNDTDTNDNDTDEILEFNKDKATKVYGKDRNEQIDREKDDKDINDDDTYETVKCNKGKANKVYEINVEKKKLLKERRENALQNAKDREAEKANAQAALQVCTRASKASKVNQDIKMTNNAITHKDSTDVVHLLLNPHRKATHSGQIKTCSSYKTICTEPLLGDPLPVS